VGLFVSFARSAAVLLAQVELRRDRYAEALALAEHAIAAGPSQGEYHILCHLTRAQALHALGRIEDLRAGIREARDLILRSRVRIEDPSLRESYLAKYPVGRTLAFACE
jgi:ATP/maltotriose-dependent transcriptional regulator MalT